MKKILYSLAILVVLIQTFNFTIVHKRVNNVSNLALQNIEALSYAETINGFCLGVGSLDCPISENKVRLVY
jgi:hypothetical protein